MCWECCANLVWRRRWPKPQPDFSRSWRDAVRCISTMLFCWRKLRIPSTGPNGRIQTGLESLRQFHSVNVKERQLTANQCRAPTITERSMIATVPDHLLRRSANCITLGSVIVLMMLPNAGVPKLPFGCANAGVFVTLNISARNSRSVRSVSLLCFTNATSKFRYAGPRTGLRDAFPIAN